MSIHSGNCNDTGMVHTYTAYQSSHSIADGKRMSHTHTHMHTHARTHTHKQTNKQTNTHKQTHTYNQAILQMTPTVDYNHKRGHLRSNDGNEEQRN